MKALEIKSERKELPTGELLVIWSPVDYSLASIADHSFSFLNASEDEILRYEKETARPSLVSTLNNYFEVEIYE